ncbi:MAG: radical SAM protein [Candidatus Gallimonas sp.]
MKECSGFVDSVYNGSAVDGKGLRCVIFFTGCNLRCPFCHNPETLYCRGEERTVSSLIAQAERYKPYFGKRGGITLSGGEPLVQEEFAYGLLSAAKERGIGTCIETNGRLFSERVFSLCDEIIVDVKNAFDAFDYREALRRLDALGRETRLTNVFLPTVNDGKETLRALGELAERYDCVKSLRLLPFRKLCEEKYARMQRPFPAAGLREPTAEELQAAREILRSVTRKIS